MFEGVFTLEQNCMHCHNAKPCLCNAAEMVGSPHFTVSPVVHLCSPEGAEQGSLGCASCNVATMLRGCLAHSSPVEHL